MCLGCVYYYVCVCEACGRKLLFSEAPCSSMTDALPSDVSAPMDAEAGRMESTGSDNIGQQQCSATKSAAAAAEAGREEEATEATSPTAGAGANKEEDAADDDKATSAAAAAAEIISRGDWPHVNGALNMTVSSGIKDDEDVEAASSNNEEVDMTMEDTKLDQDTPMNLSPKNNEEAMNLCSKSNTSTMIGLSAKMRLKKQRLADEAAAAKAKESSVMAWTTNSNGLTNGSTSTNNHHLLSDQTSALHRLAEAAERKQEEEMMEVGEITPRGTPSTPPAPPPPPQLIPRPGYNKPSNNNGLVTAHLVPHSEYEVTSTHATPTASPQLAPRAAHHPQQFAPTPSPDSAIHSAGGYYSPSQSPVQSRHVSGLSSPFSLRGTPSLSRNNSDASQYGGSANASATTSPISPTPQYSPTHSPVQARHPMPAHLQHQPQQPSSPLQQARHLALPPMGYLGVILPRHDHESRRSPMGDIPESWATANDMDVDKHASLSAQPGISRQQLINSPCPVCGDKISGFHYGIFSCESCKGFFKRTVQNKKNYQCLRGAQCPISIATRKKCPACRFNKCLNTGMKLEAIREDRTRGGRSTYQCSYTLPAGICPSPGQQQQLAPSSLPLVNNGGPSSLPPGLPSVPLPMRREAVMDNEAMSSGCHQDTLLRCRSANNFTPTPSSAATTPTPPPLLVQQAAQQEQPSIPPEGNVPPLLKEIMDVEHLWFSKRPNDMSNRGGPAVVNSSTDSGSNGSDDNMVQTLNMADRRLFKLVKWCKSLPLFKNILIDDQIALLINAWCELLVFSCCYRSVNCPGVIRVSHEKSLTMETARAYGIERWIEKMLNFADQLRRLKVDYYEYVSMKVIVLLTSDASGLKEPEHVRDSQEKVVQSLQQYTISQYPNMPSKFGELLLRMPELHRVCQGCKEMLCPRQAADGDSPGFNLLMELLRGDQ